MRVLLRAELKRRSGAGTVDPDLAHWRGFSRFAKEHLQIVDQSKQLVPFELNPIQRHIVAREISARRQGKRPWFLILKYRKGGVTTLQQALAYWQSWRHRHQECLTLAHVPQATRMIFRMVSRFYEYQPPARRHLKTQAVVNHIEFVPWGSLYMAFTSGRGGGTSRGSTYSRVHLSEAAFYADLPAEHVAMTNSVGDDSAYVIESTPNGQSGRGAAFHEFWQAAKLGKSNFMPLFFPWFSDPRNRLKAGSFVDEMVLAEIAGDAEAQELVAIHGLSLAQIGWWLEQRRGLAGMGATAALIHQEHPSDDETCFLLGADSYFDAGLIAEARTRVIPPSDVEDNNRLRIWEVPDSDTPADYSIGADPAGGNGGDDSAAAIFNAKDGEQAASYANNRIAPDEFGKKLAELGWRWKNPRTGKPAFIVVEQNNHGHAVLVGLMRLANYPLDRIYHYTDETRQNAEGQLGVVSKRPGWVTNLATLGEMTAIIGRTLREGVPVIRDAATLASIQRVGFGPSGAEFTGRDLAVAAALAAVGIPHARSGETRLYIGGQVVEL